MHQQSYFGMLREVPVPATMINAVFTETPKVWLGIKGMHGDFQRKGWDMPMAPLFLTFQYRTIHKSSRKNN